MPKQGFISASKVGVILKNGKGQTFTVGAITYAEEIAQQVIGVKPEPDFKSFDMERGIENEWLAIKTYEERELVEVHSMQEWRTHPDFHYFGGTPDGLVGLVGGVDVKCPNNNNHFKNLMHDSQAKDYYDQCQAYMAIFERDYWDLVSFNENYPTPLDLHVMRIQKDMDWQEKLNERLPLFWNLINEQVEILKGKMI